MGTSKGYLPPTGHLWSDTKRAVSGMTRNGYSSSSIGRALSRFSKATGSLGLRNEGNSAIGVSGSKALSFAGLVRSLGLHGALGEIGLSHLINKSPQEIFEGLIDYFSTSTNSIQQSIANQAMQEYMEDIAKGVSNEDELEEAFSKIETDTFIKDYLTKYIEVSFFTSFAEKIISMCQDINEAIKMQERIKEYIRIEVSEGYKSDGLKNIDWKGSEGRQYLENKCEEIWGIFELWGEKE